MIDLLERGKHWEHAIPLTKELADVYERRVFNYRKLASAELATGSRGVLTQRPENITETVTVCPQRNNLRKKSTFLLYVQFGLHAEETEQDC